MTAKKDLVKTLIGEYGELYSQRVGIQIERGTPAPLFQWLCASMLFSARIGQQIAADAAEELFQRGWTTADKLQQTTWKQRVDALNKAGYARYQERTATMLGDTADLLMERYGGDLRKLREQAQRDPQQERELLKEVKGIGDVGVDIFFREAQVVWDELAPFADDRALQAAKRLDLGNDAASLAKLTDKKGFPQLVAALVRVELEDLYEELKQSAASA